MRFSIIIPVYNVEKYIRRCMKSVMEQTFRDYEVIVVDDESPDNSMQIVEEFAEKYPGMITMLHQKNTRQGGARNRGVQHAKGEYILFVDSDDYVDRNLLEKLNSELECHDCDILVFKHRQVTPEGKTLCEEGFGPLMPGRYIPKEHPQVVGIPVGPVFKVYRRAFYEDSGFAFPQKLLYEDAMTRLLHAKASEIILFDACLYNYVQSPNSSIRQKPTAHVLDIMKVTDMVIDKFQQEGIYANFQQELDASLLVGLLYVFNLVNKSDRTSVLQDEFAEYIQHRFADYEDNPRISRENKEAIRCILQRRYRWYYFRFLRKLELTEAFAGWPPVAKLNRFRKMAIHRIRGCS